VAVARVQGQGDEIAGDDLTRIVGIGTKTAERLRARGIGSFAALAAHAPGEIIALLHDVSGLSAARVDRWRSQARALQAEAFARPSSAADDPDPDPNPEPKPDTAKNGQRYESFLVRILLNEDGSVRRMTAQHVRTGHERHWPGLDRAGLPEFIETAVADSLAPSAPPRTPEPAAQLSGRTRSDEMASAAVAPPQGAPTTAASSSPTGAGFASESVTSTVALDAATRSRLKSSAVLSVERTALRTGEPFAVTMNVEFETPQAARLVYSAIVVARPLTGGPKRTLAQEDGLLAASLSPSIEIKTAGLPAGIYRLDGAVTLREPGADRPARVAVLAEGLLLQVVPG
jgi:hypothetical protein